MYFKCNQWNMLTVVINHVMEILSKSTNINVSAEMGSHKKFQAYLLPVLPVGMQDSSEGSPFVFVRGHRPQRAPCCTPVEQQRKKFQGPTIPQKLNESDENSQISHICVWRFCESQHLFIMTLQLALLLNFFDIKELF